MKTIFLPMVTQHEIVEGNDSESSQHGMEQNLKEYWIQNPRDKGQGKLLMNPDEVTTKGNWSLIPLTAKYNTFLELHSFTLALKM